MCVGAVNALRTFNFFVNRFFTNPRFTLFNQKGKDYVEAPLPNILSFASPHNDATITFINDTAVNGVVFQHNKAFDIVASANLLLVWQHTVLHAFVDMTQDC